MTTPRDWRMLMAELRAEQTARAERLVDRTLRSASDAIPSPGQLAQMQPAEVAASVTAGLVRVQFTAKLGAAGETLTRNALIGVNGVTAATIGHEILLDAPRSVAVLQNGGTRLSRLEPATARVVTSIVAAGRSEGASPSQIASRLKTRVPAGRFQSAAVRAQVIARTEVRYAQNVAAVAVAEDAGIDEVELLDGQLPDSDDFCRSRHRTIVPLRTAMSLLDQEHPNGTLDFIPVVR